MRTYGRLTYRPGGNGAAGTWVVDAEPHVLIRAKRIFARVSQGRAGDLTITDTLDVARDLEWFLTRHPLDMDGYTRGRLTAQADAHRGREETVQAILSGQARDYGLREPARPARGYQQEAAAMALATRHLLLTDPVGLGKTTSSLLTLLAEGTLPAVIVPETHLPGQWQREIGIVLPWLRTHIAAKTTPYPVGDVDVLIVPYSKLAGWRDYLTGWARTVIFDEIQALRHNNTQRYEAAAAVALKADLRIGLTATPVYNYGGEAFNLIDVLAPGALGSREEFTREWCSDPVRGIVRDPAAFGAYLRDQGIMLCRTRKQVGRELPEVVTVVQPIMSDTAVIDAAATDAAELARLILHGGSREERWTAGGQLDMRMRQATGIAKAPYVAAFVRMILESEDKVVLVGWHRACYALWLEGLAAYHPVLYTGSETPAQKAANVEEFVHGRSRVLILSLRSGVGLDGLQEAADVVVFGELDWSPQVHEQVIGRVNRDTDRVRTGPPVAYYLVAEDGSDPAIEEVLQLKRGQAEPMLSPDGRLFARPALDMDRVRLLAEAVLCRNGTPVPPRPVPVVPLTTTLPAEPDQLALQMS